MGQCATPNWKKKQDTTTALWKKSVHVPMKTQNSKIATFSGTTVTTKRLLRNRSNYSRMSMKRKHACFSTVLCTPRRSRRLTIRSLPLLSVACAEEIAHTPSESTDFFSYTKTKGGTLNAYEMEHQKIKSVAPRRKKRFAPACSEF